MSESQRRRRAPLPWSWPMSDGGKCEGLCEGRRNGSKAACLPHWLSAFSKKLAHKPPKLAGPLCFCHCVCVDQPPVTVRAMSQLLHLDASSHSVNHSLTPREAVDAPPGRCDWLVALSIVHVVVCTQPSKVRWRPLDSTTALQTTHQRGRR